MSRRFNNRFARYLVQLTFLSLACKFLMPVGYMPAPIGEGWPATLCMTGLPAGFLAQDSAHHGHHDSDESHWQSCSFGACCSHQVTAISFSVASVPASDLPVLLTYRYSLAEVTRVPFRSRSPPA